MLVHSSPYLRSFLDDPLFRSCYGRLQRCFSFKIDHTHIVCTDDFNCIERAFSLLTIYLIYNSVDDMSKPSRSSIMYQLAECKEIAIPRRMLNLFSPNKNIRLSHVQVEFLSNTASMSRQFLHRVKTVRLVAVKKQDTFATTYRRLRHRSISLCLSMFNSYFL